MPIIAYSAHHVTKLLDVEPARSKMGDIRGFTVPACSQPRAPTQPPILSGPEMFDLTSSRYSSPPPSVVTATRSVAYIFLIPSHWLFLSIRVTLSLKSTSCNFRRPRRCHSSQRLIITNFSLSQTVGFSFHSPFTTAVVQHFLAYNSPVLQKTAWRFCAGLCKLITPYYSTVPEVRQQSR